MKAVLIGPYELGRQPFGLAQPAAWLAEAGFEVCCIDLSVESLDHRLANAALVAIHLPMYTATRIALAALARVRELAPGAHLCAYGLYAPVNATLLRASGFATVLGGEVEADLLALAQAVAHGLPDPTGGERVRLRGGGDFRVPLRSALPDLGKYARLVEADGRERQVAFTDASRGCRHLCRHCPVVPVYGGRFRAVPVEVVMADIRQQVACGATHVSFGDPDFLNGPTHARRVVEALNREFPRVTFDATIKVEHLLAHRDLLAPLAAGGCTLVISAFESFDDAVLARLDKGHTGADAARAVTLLREHHIDLSPTFVAFTPWTTVENYLELLRRLVTLELVASVAPVQLVIRLLIPAGSRLLELEEMAPLATEFDPALLGHRWHHRDPRVDALQRAVERRVAAAGDEPRRETFAALWELAHAANGLPAPALPATLGAPVAHHSEPWYCCAEPTAEQLMSF